MFLSLDNEEFNSKCIFITESIRNTVIDNSSFIRIIYSTNKVILNGIVITTPLQHFQINKYFNKWRCCFNISENSELIKKICDIEKTILEKVNIKHKLPCYKIQEQLETGYVKTFLEDNMHDNIHDNNSLLLKISGVWVSEEEYGITYKFILAH